MEKLGTLLTKVLLYRERRTQVRQICKRCRASGPLSRARGSVSVCPRVVCAYHLTMAGLKGGRLLGNTAEKTFGIESRSPAAAPDSQRQDDEQQANELRERDRQAKELQEQQAKDEQWQQFLAGKEREAERAAAKAERERVKKMQGAGVEGKGQAEAEEEVETPDARDDDARAAKEEKEAEGGNGGGGVGGRGGGGGDGGGGGGGGDRVGEDTEQERQARLREARKRVERDGSVLVPTSKNAEGVCLGICVWVCMGVCMRVCAHVRILASVRMRCVRAFVRSWAGG